MYDIAVIGAGVIGTAVARCLTRYALRVAILERDNDVACGTTKANSAIIHAGYDAPADSLKGQFNAEGNAMFDDLCRELGVPFKRIGSLVLALQPEDLNTLEALKANGEELGVPGLEILSREAVLAREPGVNPDNHGALYAPTAGIVEPWELAIACAENAVDNGAEPFLNFPVTGIRRLAGGMSLRTDSGPSVPGWWSTVLGSMQMRCTAWRSGSLNSGSIPAGDNISCWIKRRTGW